MTEIPEWLFNREPEPSATISARLCAWRVFGKDGYLDRPDEESWSTMYPVSTTPGLELSVSIGSLPDVVADALRSWRAQTIANAQDSRPAPFPPSPAERRAHMAAAEEYQELKKFQRFGTFIVFEAARAMPVMGNPEERYLWLDMDQLDLDDFTLFEVEANHLFDALIPWVAPLFGESPALWSTVVEDARPYLVAGDKAAFTVPRYSGSANRRVYTPDWAILPRTEVQNRLAAFARTPKQVRDRLEKAGRWLTLALGERDVVRQFLFAYCGLEVLAGTASAEVRQHLTAALARGLPGVPVKELLWPANPAHADDKDPYRNLVFRYASLMSVVSAGTATADTELFGVINKARNTLAHGGASDPNGLPAGDVVKLLARSLSLVAGSLQDGSLLRPPPSGPVPT